VLPVIAETLDTSLLAALDENTTQVAILPMRVDRRREATSMKAARARRDRADQRWHRRRSKLLETNRTRALAAQAREDRAEAGRSARSSS